MLRDNKLHFCKLAAHQKVARSFAAFQVECISTLCAGFVSTGGCSRGECSFPWLPGADFSTTQPYLETRSVYQALCPRRQLSGPFARITLTACRAQGGMKPETTRHLFPFYCPKKSEPYDINCHWTRTDTAAAGSPNKYFVDSDLKPVNIV